MNQIPRGIEVLVKKAAVDPEFQQLLLAKRAEAAAEIGLELTPTEKTMVSAVTSQQLEGIIARTTVPPEQRRAFLGKVAAAMLAALGVATPGCWPAITGILPDRPAKKDKAPESQDQGNQGSAPTPDQPPKN